MFDIPLEPAWRADSNGTIYGHSRIRDILSYFIWRSLIWSLFFSKFYLWVIIMTSSINGYIDIGKKRKLTFLWTTVKKWAKKHFYILFHAIIYAEVSVRTSLKYQIVRKFPYVLNSKLRLFLDWMVRFTRFFAQNILQYIVESQIPISLCLSVD